ncbi:FAD dependent oxidoreductase [Hortaea werneckii]|nr:FAD dependent oxidoreductase [Hortaea werneckii]KAI7558466.1 FAD dependent oxidoreductase [Hortaea werneckii]KAI7609215.1 FAD dependent oxidoreductase [Hortaea werneckii]KAI7641933.1 FAD dependent oxidoreductase [Hortaea werneckii]
MTTTAPELRLMMRLVTDPGQLEKYRIPTAKGAVVTEIAARLWPYKFVTHILEKLLTSTSDITGSFNLQTLTPTTGISRESSDSAGSHWTVRTERGDITARNVILATNGYTSHLLPSFSDLIVPCRGQMSALHPLDSLKSDRRLKTSLGFLGDGLDDYLIQRPNDRGGHMMFGGGRQHGPSIGVTDDSILDHKTAKYLRRRLVEALGLPEGQADMRAAETEFKAANEWTGIMGFSRDNHPFIGPVPATHGPSQHGSTDGLYMAAGFTGHGMPNTWLCGASVALMVREALDEGKPKNTSSDQVFQSAKEIYGLPEAYWLTEERLKKAMSGLSVEEQEWAEMDKAAVSST